MRWPRSRRETAACGTGQVVLMDCDHRLAFALFERRTRDLASHRDGGTGRKFSPRCAVAPPAKPHEYARRSPDEASFVGPHSACGLGHDAHLADMDIL